MLVILVSVIPLVALVVGIICHARMRGGAAWPAFGDVPLCVSGASRWEGLTSEIARHGQRPHAHPDAATCRRHLAAVLPADARR